MRTLLPLVLLICCTASAALTAAPQTKARLLLPVETARPGETIFAAVQLKMEPRWHTYWRNSGESGGPTEIKWTLPEGVSAGPIQWPVPQKHDFAGLVTYVFHDEAVLLVPLTLAPSLMPGSVELKAEVKWLECEEVCLPGKGQIKSTLAIGEFSQPSDVAAWIERAKEKLPKDGSALGARASWDESTSPDIRTLIVEWPSNAKAQDADFFSNETKAYEVMPMVEVVSFDAGKVRFRKTLKKLEGDWPTEISGLLVENVNDGQNATAFEVKLLITGNQKAAGSPMARPGAARLSPDAQSWPLMLLYAFLGGLILNIMPCVLPVIALKVLGFVQQSRDEPKRVRKLGIIYTMGVLFSFAALAGIVIGLQHAGRAAGWGMQFQNAQFVVVMTTLVTVVALNLFGVFEVTLGRTAMEEAVELASKGGALGSFFNGVFATALATPCTAPFLAVALGFAFAQPPPVIMLLFLVMGLGLAAPYLVLSWMPRLFHFLPKPGAWMEKFKIAMGFPMLATAVWLLSLTSPHFGSRGPLWVGLFLISVAGAAWIWGQFVQRGAKRKSLALALMFVFLAFGYGYALERELNWRSPKTIQSAEIGRNIPDGIDWKPWSPQAVPEARAQGRPVLVDFTADWCVTCQANKKTSLEIPSVRAKLKQINGVALLGDYTTADDRITAELRRFRRAGVPLVIVYHRDPTKPPIVLPTLLTPGIVIDALDNAVK